MVSWLLFMLLFSTGAFLIFRETERKRTWMSWAWSASWSSVPHLYLTIQQNSGIYICHRMKNAALFRFWDLMRWWCFKTVFNMTKLFSMSMIKQLEYGRGMISQDPPMRTNWLIIPIPVVVNGYKNDHIMIIRKINWHLGTHLTVPRWPWYAYLS